MKFVRFGIDINFIKVYLHSYRKIYWAQIELANMFAIYATVDFIVFTLSVLIIV